MGNIAVNWYRATCFGVPCGPWRLGVTAARADLVAQGLGSYDQDRCFFVTVPGDLQTQSVWMDFAEAAELSRTVEGGNATEHSEGLTVTNLDRPVLRVGRSRF